MVSQMETWLSRLGGIYNVSACQLDGYSVGYEIKGLSTASWRHSACIPSGTHADTASVGSQPIQPGQRSALNGQVS